MGSIDTIGQKDERLQGLLERYLLLRSRTEYPQQIAGHLDEDLLTAFVEDNLTVRESERAAGHLADCSFCRHKTAELMRLGLDLSDEAPALADGPEPVKVSEVLSGILSRLFGTGEAAVFAHEEKETDPDTEKDKTEREP